MKVFIYTLRHPETQEIRYVGLTRFPVKRLHNEINYPHTKHLQNWVNSLKKSSLKPIMEIIEESDENGACDAERKWISEMKVRGYRLINFTDGGERGYKCSDEYRAAVSAALKGRKSGPLSPEHRAKISAALKGRRLNPQSGKYFAALNAMRKGIPLSEEHRRKVSEGTRKGLTAEARLKNSLAHKGKSPHPQTAEMKAKTSAKLKIWHQKNRETFLSSMQKRGKTSDSDPVTGRFLPKKGAQGGAPRTLVSESG